jgi:hypothetical protein
MFGDSGKALVHGIMLSIIVNPTSVGDKVAIGLSGAPIVLANYKRALAEATVLGMKGAAAKAYASTQAMDVFTRYMNETQQSSKMTHKSSFQYDHYRLVTAFMNSIMAYQRKVMAHTKNIMREYKTGYKKAINDGHDSGKASMIAVSNIRPASVTSLMLYTSVLPVMWTTMSTLGGNFARLFSDDDDEREKAWWQFGFDVFLSWTKGFLGIGFLLQYGMNELLDVNYGERSDNLLPILDDTMNLIDAIYLSAKLVMKDDEAIKNLPEHNAKMYKAIGDVVIRGTTMAVHDKVVLPVTAFQRIVDITTQKEYDNAVKKIVRVYGLPKVEIQRIFDGNPLEQIDPEVAEYFDKSPTEFLNAMKEKREADKMSFSPTKELKKFTAYKVFDVEDRQTMVDVNMLLSGKVDKVLSWMDKRLEDDFNGDLTKFRAEFLGKYTRDMYGVAVLDGETVNLSSPLMTEGTVGKFMLKKAKDAVKSANTNEEKVKAVNEIRRVYNFEYGSATYKEFDEILENIK